MQVLVDTSVLIEARRLRRQRRELLYELVQNDSPHPARVLPDHGRVGFAVIGVTELGHVGYDAIDSPLSG
jgi:hypothetical protein